MLNFNHVSNSTDSLGHIYIQLKHTPNCFCFYFERGGLPPAVPILCLLQKIVVVAFILRKILLSIFIFCLQDTRKKFCYQSWGETLALLNSVAKLTMTSLGPVFSPESKISPILQRRLSAEELGVLLWSWSWRAKSQASGINVHENVHLFILFLCNKKVANTGDLCGVDMGRENLNFEEWILSCICVPGTCRYWVKSKEGFPEDDGPHFLQFSHVLPKYLASSIAHQAFRSHSLPFPRMLG